MVSYYFSCNSVQVFLMKEKYLGLQGQCTDIRCCILLTEKKPGLHWKEIKGHLSVTWVVVAMPAGSSMGSVPAKTAVGWFSEGRTDAIPKGKQLFPSGLPSGELGRVV